VATAAALVGGIQQGMSLYKDLKTKYDEKFNFTLTVTSDLDSYFLLSAWLMDKLASRKTRIQHTYGTLSEVFDMEHEMPVVIDGYQVKVGVSSPDLNNISSFTPRVKTMTFTSRTRGGIDAVVNLIKKLTADFESSRREARIYIVESYGWESTGKPRRKLDSIFLPDNTKETIVEDIEKFMASEDKYETIGVPWHRGYLLYGPPGNGKSSLVTAVAEHFRLNLHVLNLSSIKDDKQLESYISSMTEKSILLIEDADIISSSVTRTDHPDGVTLVGLLNALDGVATPHGMITFMTTNYIDRLDDALIRSGRMDMRVSLEAPARAEVEAMFKYVYDVDLDLDYVPDFKSMADFANILKMNLDDADNARKEISKYEF
jgi:chaperone BCS1